MLAKTSWYSTDVSGNDRHILLFYKKCNFLSLASFCQSRVVYYGFNFSSSVVEAASSDEEESKELGGLFILTKPKESKKKLRKGMNDLDCSSFPVESVRDWTSDEVRHYRRSFDKHLCRLGEWKVIVET